VRLHDLRHGAATQFVGGLDPHRDYLRKRRAEEPGVPVQQLLREIRELGYQGSSNLLICYISQGRAEGGRPHLSPRRAARDV
jgi:hypothetical protein